MAGIGTDPRGPYRTVKAVEWTTTGNLVQFEECEHIGQVNATMTVKVGSRGRCFACGPWYDNPTRVMAMGGPLWKCRNGHKHDTCQAGLDCNCAS